MGYLIYFSCVAPLPVSIPLDSAADCIYAGGIRHRHVAFGWQRGRTIYSFLGVGSRDPNRLLPEVSQLLRNSPDGQHCGRASSTRFNNRSLPAHVILRRAPSDL